MIEAAPPAGAPAISAEAMNKATVVHGLVVVGKDETAAGQASIVMAASHSNGITLQRSVLVAGRGGNGGPGGTTQSGNGGGGQSPPEAHDGGPGGVACAAQPNPNAGTGGKGGDHQNFTQWDCGLYYCSCTGINEGSFGSPGVPSGAVAGGAFGNRGGPGCGCAYVDGVPDGVNGGPGAMGACATQGGPPAGRFGSFQGAHWVAAIGGSGGAGSVGSGGGGGGAGGVAARVEYGEDPDRYPGNPGGGGGGGGCGGAGGSGGQQGGASIALVLVASSIAGVPDRNSLVPGPGGQGGAGGRGGTGGAGGPGGAGLKGHGLAIDKPAVCSANVPGSGADGGPGGQGGAAGGGAGGNGGPSIGIALVSGAPNPGSASGIYNAQPGLPGERGGGGRNAPTVAEPNPCPAPAGQDGLPGGAALVLASDGMAPANLLVAGQQLLPLQSLASPNGKYVLVNQDDGNLCLLASGVPTWCSGTNGIQGLITQMRTDGNLVVYDPQPYNPDYAVRYQSGTDGRPGSYLAVQDDGNIVIYDGTTRAWIRPL